MSAVDEFKGVFIAADLPLAVRRRKIMNGSSGAQVNNTVSFSFLRVSFKCLSQMMVSLLLMVRLCSVLLMALCIIMSDCHANMLRVVLYNSRGFNNTKKQYIRRILSNYNILLLREHWLADGHLVRLTSLSVDHVVVGISGFDDSGVLRGRLYSGCAIIRKSSLNLMSPIVANIHHVGSVV